MKKVLNRLKKACSKIQTSKCKFSGEEIKFLGHVSSEKGLQVIEAIKKFPVPENLKQLQRFSGVCYYFRRFINEFSDLAASIHKLLKKKKNTLT